MNRIESLIFNELASHRAVALPRVGTLRVVRRHAQTEGGEVKAPENQVVYSLETDGDIPTLGSLGVDEHEYNQWLDGALKDDKLTIEGVGTLVLGEFTLSPELDRALNPSPEHEECAAPAAAPAAAPVHHEVHHEVHHAVHKPEEHTHAHHSAAHHEVHHAAAHHAVHRPSHVVRQPRRGNCMTNILLIVAIVLLLALAGLWLWRTYLKDRNKVELTTQVQVEEPVARDVAPVVEAPAEPEFHLLTGSFDDPANAEKMAARYRRNYPELDVTTLDNGAGRTLVSIFKSNNQHVTYNKFYRLAEQTGNWEMWVFERVPAQGDY
jgi:hypothetical protein